MSHARMNSLPTARTRPSICAIETRRLELRWRSIAIEFGGGFPVLFDSRHVYVSNKVVGVGALEHNHLTVIVSFGSLNKRDEIADQLRPQQIHWRRRDLNEQNAAFPAHLERFKIHDLNQRLVGCSVRYVTS